MVTDVLEYTTPSTTWQGQHRSSGITAPGMVTEFQTVRLKNILTSISSQRSLTRELGSFGDGPRVVRKGADVSRSVIACGSRFPSTQGLIVNRITKSAWVFAVATRQREIIELDTSRPASPDGALRVHALPFWSNTRERTCGICLTEAQASSPPQVKVGKYAI